MASKNGKTMADEEIALILANRSFMYALLARAYAEEPDHSFVSLARGDHAYDEVMLIEDCFSDDLEKAYLSCRRLLVDDGFSLQRLQQEYMRIFVGPATLKASPWETMHTNKKRVLFQPDVLKIRDAYRQAGFLPKRYPSVSDDFIGLECDFMAKLADRATHAFIHGGNALGDVDPSRAKRQGLAGCKEVSVEKQVRTCLEQSHGFLCDHLLRWIDSLADAICENYEEGFYALMTRFAAIYVKRDRMVLEALLK